ncbi:sirohydrochlorin cobaltochelatase [Treponema sp.]|uniref:sirohydrochlorin cobaltochelatase n=1 Tax=Treponema sp. TaxID=166 RepID=UPI00298E16E5|nr:sirohydrochlorin cobaltochelatase [Treponema sp.]MCR5612603.1 sirohydrochlorin cobaltochelatase [Treponema sp.]
MLLKKILSAALLTLSVAVCANAQVENHSSKKEIIIASYGTTYDKTRTITIGGIENAFREAFPDYKIERVFTFQVFIDALKKKNKLKVLNIEEALEKALSEGVEEIVIQPTFVLTGNELNKFFDRAKEYESKFKKMTICAPLITNDTEMKEVAKIFVERTSKYDDGQTAVCIMGHGNDSDSNLMYKKMEKYLHKIGKTNYFVGTVHDDNSVSEILEALSDRKDCKNVVLIPMMITAGEHIIHDMAGEDDDSWKNIFSKNNYKVICIFEGMGQNYEFQEMFVNQTKKALGIK